MQQALKSGKGFRGCSNVISNLIRRSFTSLPVIDVSPLVNPTSSSADVQRIGRQLDAAIRECGFFYVTGHGIPDTVSTSVLHHARTWFALPPSIKHQIALSPATHYRGYQALGANVTRYENGFTRDHHEGIDLYKEAASPDALAALRPSPIHGVNPWPSQVPQFEAALKAYIGGCLVLGRQLMRGIATGLNLPPDTFEGGRAGDSYWVTRVIYYPPLEGRVEDAAAAGAQQAAAAGEDVGRAVPLSCGEHTDYGLLTIVNQEAEVAALQVKNAAGKWITADPIPGTFVCNVGDMFKVWTNGQYRPTEHRVVNAAGGRSRVSIPFFYEPNFDAVVKPLPQFVTADRPAQFPSVRYGDHLESKVLKNFELEGLDAAA